MFYNNSTRSITLKPYSSKYAGKIYYFTIVVKEKHSYSPYNRKSYTCIVQVKGENTDNTSCNTQNIMLQNSPAEDVTSLEQIDYTNQI